nr:beta-propeller domain-containing protein [Candidatus Poseidoniaceae archaeon]
YIHPMADGYLLTIGMAAANADGTGLDWGRTQISQFNVTDLTTPTLLDALALSPVSDPDDNTWNWGWSEATYEHKAFQYWEPKEMLAIPLSTYRSTSWYDSSGNYRWSYQYVSQLVLLNAAPGENLSVHGTIDHSDFYNTEDNYWWGGSSIRRTIFMGDYVYAISPAGVTAHELDSLNETASVQLWSPELDDYRYYGGDTVDASGEAEEDDGDESSSGSSGSSSGSDDTTREDDD